MIRTATTLALLALSPSALALDLDYTPKPTVYVEGGLGIDRHEGHGFFGQRTLGQFSVGIQGHNLFLEYRHQSNVQLRDEGDDALWIGFRKDFAL